MKNRGLKIQQNLLKDENVRLKTKIQQMIGEQQRNEKDLETLMYTLQADKNSQIKTNYTESFLVQQLKKHNRQLKTELNLKEQEISELKQNVKLSKFRESESDI